MIEYSSVRSAGERAAPSGGREREANTRSQMEGGGRNGRRKGERRGRNRKKHELAWKIENTCRHESTRGEMAAGGGGLLCWVRCTEQNKKVLLNAEAFRRVTRKRRRVSIYLLVLPFLLLTMLTPRSLLRQRMRVASRFFFTAQCEATNPLGNTGDNKGGAHESEEDERVQRYHGGHTGATTNLADVSASRGLAGQGLLCACAHEYGWLLRIQCLVAVVEGKKTRN